MAVTKYYSYVVGNACPLGIETASKPKNVFYPNPVEKTLFLQLTDFENRIFLTDILGRKLIDATVPSLYLLDMSTFKTGIYFLRVENMYGVEYQKIIKK